MFNLQTIYPTSFVSSILFVLLFVPYARTVRNLMLHGSSSFLIVCLVCPCFSFCLCVMTYVIICLLCVVCHSVVWLSCAVFMLKTLLFVVVSLWLKMMFVFSCCKQQPRRSYHYAFCSTLWNFHLHIYRFVVLDCLYVGSVLLLLVCYYI